MPPLKLFISYRSLDSAKVDAIVSRLGSLKNEDETARYIPWQDKTGIPGAKDWWEAIVDAIIDCDVFVFNISQEALKSDVCRAELSYARKRNRPIIPVVLEGEFSFNDKTGKNEISYWKDIPAELNDLRAQFLFYDGSSFFQRFDRSLAEFMREPQKWRDIPASRPGDPREGSETAHDGITLYDDACDYAGRMEFTTAEKLFQKLVNRNDPDFGAVAFEWIELLRHYERLLALDAKGSTRFRVRSAWDEYQKLFPKDFLEGIFDPKEFAKQYPTSITQNVLKNYPTLAADPSRSVSLMPKPFAWIDITAGKVTIEGRKDSYIKRNTVCDAPAFTMSKYLITNAQFAKFVEARGYSEKRWWTGGGWILRETRNWTQPRYWIDEKWKRDDYPVVGISWYESIAFCHWLSDESGETITLPTEQQWQRAAQGDNRLVYPWGNDWDGARCNNSVKPFDSTRTSSVNEYEGKGDSPYGVVDMAGNVREWCLNSYKDGSEEIDTETEYRSLRGGSWHYTSPDFFRTANRSRGAADSESSNIGFRCVRKISLDI
jgi:formylglycine-generating enzyme required for sulfatase activity